MGSPEFAVPTLQALVNRGHDIVCVYSQPPRPAGRGKKLRQTAVHDAAEKAGIPVLTPTSLKTEEAQGEFASHKADLAVVAAYGLLLPQVILDTPRLGCLNVHASLLPRWRGAAPIHRAILAGDPVTGISIMQMTLGLDEGPVLAREEIAITPDMTSASLHDVLAATGGPLLVEAMEALDRGELTAEGQDDAASVYAQKLTKAEAALDWTKSADALDRQIRAFTPWPGATLRFGEEVIKVLGATPDTSRQTNAKPGTLVDEDLSVACGQGVLHLKRLQRPGKKPLDKDDFLRGLPLKTGTKLD